MRLAPFRVQRSIYLFLADDMRLAPLGQSVDQSDSTLTVAHISGSGSQPYSTKEPIEIFSSLHSVRFSIPSDSIPLDRNIKILVR